ncbi:DNA polymerase III subunit delta' [Nemorincola caseinilytica]|uniref:DNA polymerase III subunit delta n=2 Tax=Nemorincola caseinilytica TaxID=2054315 RepID=A0ABP8N440_9BACT
MWGNNTFPHALLITGAEGTGGLPLALALAQYIFCEQKSEFDSCGKCPGCSKVARLEHADLHLSFPSISHRPGVKPMSKQHMQEFREFVKQTPYGTTFEWLQFIGAENKQGNITADECREIIETLYLRSYEGGKKVLLMWRPEYLGKEGNILLKLIEEPPQDTIMIFVAEQRENILATIRSRTQEVRLVPIPATDIADALTARTATDPSIAAQVAQIAMGSYTEALRLIRHSENDLFPEVRQMFNILFTNNGAGVSKFVEDWSKAGREQQKDLLHYIIQLLEHAIKARYAPNAPIALQAAEAEFVRKLAGTKLSFEGMNDMTKVLGDTIYYIERNAHSKTQLHAMLIKMHHIVLGVKMPI